MAKTSIRLKYAPSIWPLVEKWADEHQYSLAAPGKTSRLYLRSLGDENNSINVSISQADDAVHIEAWYSDRLRKEIEIDSLSLYAALPRKEANTEIQTLLAAFGAIPHGKAKKKTGSTAFNLGRSLRKLSGKK